MEDQEDLPSPAPPPALHGGDGNWVPGDTSFGMKAKGRKPLGRKNAWHGISNLGTHKMDAHVCGRNVPPKNKCA